MGLLRDRIRAWIIDRLGRVAGLQRQRAQLLAAVGGEVLEVGFGGGSSLAFYPEGTRVTAVERDAAMCRLALERHDPLRLVRADGERLPFSDASFDGAVFALTLCSVANPAAILSEAARVLRPGGRLHYLEHVAADDDHGRAWQRRVDRVHRLVSAGCRLGRDTEASIREAGFHVDARHPFHLRRAGSRVNVLFPFVRGVAVKVL